RRAFCSLLLYRAERPADCVPSPAPGVRHRSPRLRLVEGGALLEQFDGDTVRRLDEGHVAVARRAVDGDAGIHQALAGVVDIVDLVGEMAEVAPALVVLRIPVEGELDERRLLVDAALLVLGRGEEDQRVATLL